MYPVVGGWTNPFEKYDRQNGFIFPNFRGEHKQYLSCHHLDFIYSLQKLTYPTLGYVEHHRLKSTIDNGDNVRSLGGYP